MRKIEIDEDIYQFLLRNTQELGESASSILRRLLRLPTPGQTAPEPVATVRTQVPSMEVAPVPVTVTPRPLSPNPPPSRSPSPLPSPTQGNSAARPGVSKHPLLVALENAHLEYENKAIDRFLKFLSALERVHKAEFRKVLRMGGRERVYFAESEQEISRSGSSTFPRKIPGTLYWVVTNNDTPKKQRMIHDVLEVLGYEYAEAQNLARLVDPDSRLEVARITLKTRQPASISPQDLTI